MTNDLKEKTIEKSALTAEKEEVLARIGKKDPELARHIEAAYTITEERSKAPDVDLSGIYENDVQAFFRLHIGEDAFWHGAKDYRKNAKGIAIAPHGNIPPVWHPYLGPKKYRARDVARGYIPVLDKATSQHAVWGNDSYLYKMPFKDWCRTIPSSNGAAAERSVTSPVAGTAEDGAGVLSEETTKITKGGLDEL